jgi:NDP-sugar pyrophosphorylase family protein
LLKCIIPAAGEATRFLPLSMYQEKSLFYVAGKPVVRRIVDDILAGLGEVEIIITVDEKRLADFKHEFRDIYHKPVWFAPVDYSPSTVYSYMEGVLQCNVQGNHDVLLHYADSFVEGLDYQGMYNGFRTGSRKDCVLAVTKNLRHEYSEVSWDAETGIVRKFEEKPTMPAWTWTGIAFFRQDIFMQTFGRLGTDAAKLDFGKDIFPFMIQTQQAIYAYPITGRYVDCGNILGYWRFMKETEQEQAKDKELQAKTRS